MGVLNKLSWCGDTGTMLRWLQAYLKDRPFKVFMEGTFSSERIARSGVLQGAVLSPLLFNIMMYDTPVEERISSCNKGIPGNEAADEAAKNAHLLRYCTLKPSSYEEIKNLTKTAFKTKWKTEWLRSIQLTGKGENRLHPRSPLRASAVHFGVPDAKLPILFCSTSNFSRSLPFHAITFMPNTMLGISISTQECAKWIVSNALFYSIVVTVEATTQPTMKTQQCSRHKKLKKLPNSKSYLAEIC
ncbi:Reverse transcriptase domain [Trinorchestia longiramus]|nr:Reverse transcriptase domain [Trinorchestia longiramus]